MDHWLFANKNLVTLASQFKPPLHHKQKKDKTFMD